MDGKPDRIVVFFDSQDAPGAIHMTRHNMPAEPSIRSHCPFQIDFAPDHKTCKRGAVQGFMHNIGRKAVCKKPGNGQADAIHCDAVTDFCVFQNGPCLNVQHFRMLPMRDLLYGSDFFYNSSEHGYSTSLSIRISSPRWVRLLFFSRNAALGT